MSDLVRVRLENGNEKTVGREFAEMVGLDVLDEPTHNGDGTLRAETRKNGRPLLPKTTVAKKAAAKKTASAESSAESSAE